MNHRKPVTSAKLIVSALVAAYAAMFVATAGAAPADQAPPVVLFSDAKGGTYTYDVKSTRAGGHTISKRSVSVAEIGAIRADGFEVALQSEAADALVSVLPANISIIRRYGTYYGNIWTSGTRPTGTTTQWLTFDFSSYDYHGEHAPISLFLDASALAAPTPFIVGNGMIIGDVHGRTADDGGCGSSSWPNVPIFNSQVEAYWAGGNWLYGATCLGTGLQNGTTYSFVLHASTGGWVAYWSSLGSPAATYTLNQRPTWNPDNGGVFIGSTNDDPLGADFTLTFENVQTGWF